jgi:hypothetical protein
MKTRSLAALLLAASLLVTLASVCGASRASLGAPLPGANFALGKPVKASSVVGSGSTYAASWTTIYTQTNSPVGVVDSSGMSSSGRYVRLNGPQCSVATVGHSLWEFEVYGSLATATPIPPTGTATLIFIPGVVNGLVPDIPPTATATPTDTPAPPTITPTPANTPTSTPAPCTAANLTKGPTLIYAGANTEMRVAWQWSANTTFQLRWGTDATYSLGTADVTAYDTTNRMYGYTVTGLTPGSRYIYQAVVGTQCASGSFYTAPDAAAADVKFVSYGDTRTNGGVHDGLAGQVISLYQSDPAFQTLNLHVGDWVTGDTEAFWTSDWFSPGYGNIRTQDANIADLGVRGNHEGAATYWLRYFPQPWQPNGLYRSLDYGPMHVALLDQYTDYKAGTAQYDWLRSDLAATTKAWKFVVLHEPGWSAGGGHENNVTVQNDLQPLFKQYGVSIVFGGHNHYYARAVVDGVTHLTVGGGGAPLSAPQAGYPNIVAMSSSYSFGEFSIAGDALTAQIVDNSGAVIDSFTIMR